MTPISPHLRLKRAFIPSRASLTAWISSLSLGLVEREPVICYSCLLTTYLSTVKPDTNISYKLAVNYLTGAVQAGKINGLGQNISHVYLE